MTIYGLWHGGSGYSHGDLVDDLEAFDSIKRAKVVLEARKNYPLPQRTAFVNKPNLDTPLHFPCVGDDSEIWLWLAADYVDGKVMVPEYPDRIVKFGPRGGVRVERA